MLLHLILSHLLVNSFYSLTEGSKVPEFELSIIKEIDVLRTQQLLSNVDGRTIKADQHLIKTAQDVLKTDIEKVLWDQNQIEASQCNIKDEIVGSKGNRLKRVSDFELIKADQKSIKELILNIAGAQEKLESILPNITAAITPQEPHTCDVNNKEEKGKDDNENKNKDENGNKNKDGTDNKNEDGNNNNNKDENGNKNKDGTGNKNEDSNENNNKDGNGNKNKDGTDNKNEHGNDNKHKNKIACNNGTHVALIPSYSNASFTVPCDVETQDGNWLILLRRTNGSEKFNRTWKEYKNGFGSHDGEFFLGLDKIHALTSNRSQELFVQLEDFKGAEKYEQYESFAIGNETDFYKLTTLGAASGDAGDSLRYHVGMNFSTSDRDNDASNTTNCAKHYASAGWFNKCHTSNLLGTYNDTRFGKGITWEAWHGDKYSLKRAVMMIRPIFNK